MRQKQVRERIDRTIVDNIDLLSINDITIAFDNFYKSLFTLEDNDVSKLIRHKCKSLIPNKIYEVDAILLNSRVSLQEIISSINSLKDDKAPGPNGLPTKFYKANVDWIMKDLYSIYILKILIRVLLVIPSTLALLSLSLRMGIRPL